MVLIRFALAALSFLCPGTGQIVRGHFAKGFGLGVFILIDDPLLLLFSGLKNDSFLLLMGLLGALEVLVRLYSAFDAAFAKPVLAGDGFGSSRWQRTAFLSMYVVAFFVVNSAVDGGRFQSYSIAAGNTALLPEFGGGLRLLGVPHSYWERELAKGDFVVIEKIDSDAPDSSPYLFRIQGVTGDVCSFQSCENVGSLSDADDSCMIPEGRYLVETVGHKGTVRLVDETEVTGKVEYVYWPLSAMRKL
ncbi:hypothetical protein [Oleidesulfovibrio sp.]|uniref:hypothetical protein n=1 Tax=Oleidesulfovibrio sp. TaxID=2909707 RepID=UPI003A8708DE